MPMEQRDGIWYGSNPYETEMEKIFLFHSACQNVHTLDQYDTDVEELKSNVLGGLSMKIALIGPWHYEIPPDRWGAVEMMIWDYAIILKDLGHRVQIINTPDKDVIKFEVEYGKFDVVHLHYDVFADILISCTTL